jgi:hypothetical protein
VTTRVFDPDVASAPVHAPEAVHPVAFVDDQVSIVDPSIGTLVAELLSIAVGSVGPADDDPPPHPDKTPAAATATFA